jgi:endonuclease YncB( thermonuclease family)
MWQYRAALIRIIDGDTIVVLADTGFDSRHEQHIRLLGVSAPELSQPGGVEAWQFTRDWCLHLPVITWPMILTTQPSTAPTPDERRSLTRYLGTITDRHRTLNTDLGAYLDTHPEWGHGN